MAARVGARQRFDFLQSTCDTARPGPLVWAVTTNGMKMRPCHASLAGARQSSDRGRESGETTLQAGKSPTSARFGRLACSVGPVVRQRVLDALCLLLLTTSMVRAQWSVVYLHSGANGSRAQGVHGGQQVGQSASHACLWNGSPASPIDLNPASALSSWCFGTDGTQQVGQAMLSLHLRASLWTGSAASWVNLSPPGAVDSLCNGVSSGQQVGEVSLSASYVPHASLWSGSPASWVDLNPAGSLQSQAFAAAGGQQIGVAYVPAVGTFRASLWNGSAASWMDLTPFAAGASFAYGADVGQQVGKVSWAGVNRASLWNGTAASWLSLHPIGAAESCAYAVHAGQQVGSAFFSGVERAGLWSGTAASWVDLHAFLPPDFIRSRALAIWHEGSTTYVAGHGYNNTLLRDEALLWVSMPPVTFGAGCPGTGGLVPTIGAVGIPTLGNTGFGVRVTQGLPNSLCVLIANFAAANIPVGPCTVLVAQPWVDFVGPTDGGGAFTFGLPISTDVNQVGLDIYWQGAVLDPVGVLLGLASMSGGLKTRIGF